MPSESIGRRRADGRVAGAPRQRTPYFVENEGGTVQLETALRNRTKESDARVSKPVAGIQGCDPHVRIDGQHSAALEALAVTGNDIGCGRSAGILLTNRLPKCHPFI